MNNMTFVGFALISILAGVSPVVRARKPARDPKDTIPESSPV